MNRSWRLLLLGLSLYTLFFICFLNRETPFRAEHWALLSGMANASTMRGWTQTVSQFVCFGVQRFQPLAFFPTAFSYVFFANHYFFHLLLGGVLQGALAVTFIYLIHHVRAPGRQSSFRHKMLTYAPEFSLMLLLFPAADLVLWSFFHYIQWALLFSSVATLFLLEDLRKEEFPRGAGVALSILATLLYEPFLVLVLLQAGVFGFLALRKKRLNFTAFLPPLFIGAIGFKYFHQYGEYYSTVAGFNELQKQMVSVPFPEKILITFEKTLLTLIELIYAIGTPAQAIRNQIYEMSAVPFVKEKIFDFHTFSYVPLGLLHQILGAAVIAGLVLFALIFRFRTHFRNTTRPFFLLAFLATAPFFLIAWGRPVFQDIAVSLQFRYAMVVALPFLVIALEIFRRFSSVTSVRWYYFMIYFFIFANAVSTVRHAVRVRNDMLPLRAYLETREGSPVKNALSGILDEALNLKDPSAYVFTYNAQRCLAEWKER